MKKIITVSVICGITGFLVTYAGYQATKSYWMCGVTFPLSFVMGLVIGREIAEL